MDKKRIIAHLECKTAAILDEFFTGAEQEFNLPEFTSAKLDRDADSFHSGNGDISITISVFDAPEPHIALMLTYSGDDSVLNKFMQFAERALAAPVNLSHKEDVSQNN